MYADGCLGNLLDTLTVLQGLRAEAGWRGLGGGAVEPKSTHKHKKERGVGRCFALKLGINKIACTKK